MKNTEELKQFFAKHQFYTVNEIALKNNMSPTTVRRWMTLAGIVPYKHENYKNNTMPSAEDLVVESWNNKAWFDLHYTEKGYGVRRIASMINRSRSVTLKFMRKYGIQLRTQPASIKHNDKCNKEWLVENYVKQLKSLRKCADEAGVNPCTITNWLIKFGMRPRDYQAAIAKYWYKKKYGTVV